MQSKPRRLQDESGDEVDVHYRRMAEILPSEKECDQADDCTSTHPVIAALGEC
jgi:hypothetical protein